MADRAPTAAADRVAAPAAADRAAAPAAAAVDPLDLVDPARFARRGYPHELWATMRAAAPVAYLEPEGYLPFWAVTRYADVVDVASRPERFSSEHGLILGRATGTVAQPAEMVVTLDPPRHGPLRRAAMGWFTPKAVRSRHQEVDRIAAGLLDGVAAPGTEQELDFVERVAAPLPIAVISSILGVPRSDWRLLFRWTNEIIGKDDPELRRPGETPGQTIRRARGELHAYLGDLIDRRRREPGDDLVSHLLQADAGGAPLTPVQLLNYAELIVEAGNETTRNAISGGLLAFADHRDQWDRLREEPALVPSAVEEILRWVSPIIHFTRTATEDCEIRGEQVAAGDRVALFYASANRDEDVFTDPYAFRVDRTPNRHLAFGTGPHFCMGAHLARVELEVLFRHLLARLERFEVAAPPERLSSAVNGGIKHLRLRCRLRS